MLTEKAVWERAEYCYCVCLQLNWLSSNYDIEPVKYLEYLNRSSLKLGGDQYVVRSIQEALISGQEDGGINELIIVYEALTQAFCEVLETSLADIKHRLEPGLIRQLAGEMDVKLKA